MKKLKFIFLLSLLVGSISASASQVEDNARAIARNATRIATTTKEITTIKRIIDFNTNHVMPIPEFPSNETRSLALRICRGSDIPQWEPCRIDIYKIGDIGPAGGWVFYIEEGGIHGLEAAPEDQQHAEWGCYGIDVGADGLHVGAGKTNTAAILSKKCESVSIAAKVASDYTLNGHTNWFLPSIDELELMYNNLKTKDLGEFHGGSYSSSSEYNSNVTKAWFENFSNGIRGPDVRYHPSRVRAIRNF